MPKCEENGKSGAEGHGEVKTGGVKDDANFGMKMCPQGRAKVVESMQMLSNACEPEA